VPQQDLVNYDDVTTTFSRRLGSTLSQSAVAGNLGVPTDGPFAWWPVFDYASIADAFATQPGMAAAYGGDGSEIASEIETRIFNGAFGQLRSCTYDGTWSEWPRLGGGIAVSSAGAHHAGCICAQASRLLCALGRRGPKSQILIPRGRGPGRSQSRAAHTTNDLDQVRGQRRRAHGEGAVPAARDGRPRVPADGRFVRAVGDRVQAQDTTAAFTSSLTSASLTSASIAPSFATAAVQAGHARRLVGRRRQRQLEVDVDVSGGRAARRVGRLCAAATMLTAPRPAE